MKPETISRAGTMWAGAGRAATMRDRTTQTGMMRTGARPVDVKLVPTRHLAAVLLLLAGALHLQASDYDFIVAKDGSGDFLTVQEAINAAPDYCKQAGVSIFIKEGVYKEKVTVPANKQKLHLIGEDALRTIITHDDYALKLGSTGHPMGTSATSTIFVYAEDFLAEDLTFENSAGEGKDIGQACAITVDADRAAFIRCRFVGNQDTVYTFGKWQKQYFKDCWIEGTTDFIFGASTAFFDGCTILSKKDSYITAASTPEGARFGYVFRSCRFIHGPEATKVYLGRPWRNFAKTVLVDCWLDDHILKEGWHNWSKPYAEKTTFYAESGSSGPGAASRKDRVRWSHRLREKKTNEYVPSLVLDTGTELDKNGVPVKIEWFFKVF